MTSIVPFTFKDYSIRMLCNASDEQDGLILPLDIELDLDCDGFLEAIQIALRCFPYIRADEWFKEYGAYADARDLQSPIEVEYAKLVLDAANQGIPHVSQLSVSFAKATLEREEERIRQEASTQRRLKPGFVYLIEATTGHFKIGRATNPDDRIRTFNVKLPFEVEYLCLIKTIDMRGLEAELHMRYASKRINGEWFALDPEDVEYIKGLAT